MEKTKIRYYFNQLNTALTAFIGNLRIKINNFPEFTNRYGTIPVMLIETGDESYSMLNKFRNEQKELYLKVPRVVLNIEDFSLETDQDTNRIAPINYVLPINNTNELWEGNFRRRSISIPIMINFVCDNYISALEFSELALTILTKENITTYNYLANDYPLDYQMSNISIEKNSMDMGGSKNVIVKVSVDLKLVLMIPRYDTLHKIGETLSHTGNEGLMLDNNGNNINQSNQSNQNNQNSTDNNNNNQQSGRNQNTRLKTIFRIESQMCETNNHIPAEKEKIIKYTDKEGNVYYTIPETYLDFLDTELSDIN